jgi:coenzyme F420 hydrogenase subunit beta
MPNALIEVPESAKPCDVSAMRSLARVDPRVDRQVRYLLTIFCGGVHNEKVPLQIIRHHGVEASEVGVFRYRGFGWPGPLRVETSDGTRHDLTYEQAWLSGGQTWRYELQFRCKICPDAVGESADLSAPDGWVLCDGKPVYEEAPGTNALLVRTARGQDLVRRAVAAGALLLAPLSAAELEQMHTNHLDRRLGAPAQQLALQVTGSRRVALRRYRPLAAVRAAGFRRLWAQFIGTVRRVRRGDNVEPPVDPTSLPAGTGSGDERPDR